MNEVSQKHHVFFDPSVWLLSSLIICSFYLNQPKLRPTGLFPIELFCFLFDGDVQDNTSGESSNNVRKRVTVLALVL